MKKLENSLCFGNVWYNKGDVGDKSVLQGGKNGDNRNWTVNNTGISII